MLAKLLVLCALVHVAVGCFGLGGCGGGCGMSCGRYCAKARGSKTLSLSNKPVRQNPDEEFMACCQERELPGACLSKCNYRSYTAAALRSMFFRLDACPIEAASAIHFCASRGKDHRTCCGRGGVGNTEAGARCFLFCDEEPRNRTQLDLSFLPCLDKFEQMKQCFWNDVTGGPVARNAIPAPTANAYGIRNVLPGPQAAVGHYDRPYSPNTPAYGHNYAPANPFSGGALKPLQPLAVSPL